MKKRVEGRLRICNDEGRKNSAQNSYKLNSTPGKVIGRYAVAQVPDHRYARKPGCESSNDVSFQAIGVNYLRMQSANRTR